MGQKTSALKVYLQDLERAGVTDFAGDIPFNAMSDKIENPKREAVQVSAPANVAPVNTAPVQSAASVETAQKPVAPYADPKVLNQKQPVTPKASEAAKAAVWCAGVAKSKAELQVIVFQKTVDTKQAFEGSAKTLFEKMMEAILQPLEGIRYIMHSDTEDMSTKIMAELNTEIPVLLVGQDSCEALAGKTLSDVRENCTFENISTLGVVAHPSLLLKQSVLKRTAWQDLLTFVEKWEANA